MNRKRGFEQTGIEDWNKQKERDLNEQEEGDWYEQKEEI